MESESVVRAGKPAVPDGRANNGGPASRPGALYAKQAATPNPETDRRDRTGLRNRGAPARSKCSPAPRPSQIARRNIRTP